MEKTPEYGDKNITRTLIILLIILAFASFFLLYLLLPIDKFRTLTESFNRIAVGISALGAVILGQFWVNSQIEKERKIKEYLKKYPHDKFDKDWVIIEPENLPGAYYIFEKKSKMIHHILNMKTVYDLGWHIYLQFSQKIKDNEFRQYKVGDRIRTQGEAGE